ncbi:ATP-binding protein [uncultured Hymenobacter sp.]|uniref:ATP-binding protein n=1 Tax=uncultured Hymenobacter sp. TaxID=170016 RepID=UPI0035CA0741
MLKNLIPWRALLWLAGLLLLLPAVRAQSGATGPAAPAALRVERLPARGLMLEKSWRYHAGDNPAWARPDFNDSDWQELDLGRPQRELPPHLQTGISWLRLRLRVGDSLRRHTLLLQMGALGAWELYLNGRLLQHKGTLHPAPARVHLTGRWDGPESVELPRIGPGEQVLALRFAPWRPPLVWGTGINPPLGLRLLTEWQARAQVAERGPVRTVHYVVAGVFGLLTLLHLAFFRYNPARRANLYFALYAGALALGALSVYYNEVFYSADLTPHIALAVFAYALLMLSSLAAVRALYALFHFRPGRIYAGLWVSFGGLLVFGALYLFGAGLLGYLVSLVLATAEELRLTARALRQRQRGAWIIGTGFAGSFLAVLAQVVLQFGPFGVSALASNLLFTLTCLPPALGISLFLAREFALDAELLQVKLAEVEQLAAQTLTQEQEKQALLAAQNETLERQVAQRTQELRSSLTELQATQNQLIQQEKMASLGELTAGIAHEIQNPLNFVNNFSEVSTELCQEAQELLEATRLPSATKAELTGLLADLSQNQLKISQHGQRAASIVRGMLEHSRQSTGERAPVDLNALAQEYRRLAYQGLRAKDKSFNAELKTDFAADLPLVPAVGADVGRVLLNLFGNAFYAVQQRQQRGEAGYQPTVSVRTRQVGAHVEIRVRDNGTGIPAAVRARIFQPFFTTKPTGEGTGLGLSLSYDIITKGHGGTLRVESREGEGTEFIVSLPGPAETN